MASSLTGNKPASSSGVKKVVGQLDTSGCRPGVVTIVDVQDVVDPQVMYI